MAEIHAQISLEELSRMMVLKTKGFYCSQIIIMMGLEAQGKSNPDLVKAMHGLARGIGHCGDVCGALTGGACLLALYSGRGTEEEAEGGLLAPMVTTLWHWFQREYDQTFGSNRCNDILENDPVDKTSRCPALITMTYQKVKEILNDFGFALGDHEDD
ncbi:MAG TPA: C-GCAxxG-C-C family protein [Thermodesulfobacteriota bacterium]|nr:C-GCAxxG-C-C family protein [Thermodesulfobacteriota bacterium]HQO77368.1 C-GCAxxG-C-C family protein [Thermodesulfobacteriota bacterium]